MFKKIALSLIILLVITGIALSVILQPPKPPASQAFINATVLTIDKDNSVAQAIFVEDDRIQQVGSNEQIKALINSDTVVHDLQGKTLMPGFIDAHGHFPGSAMATLNVDLNSPPIGKINTIDEMIAALQAKAANTPKGEWVLGVGYDDTMLAEQRHPNRLELDAALPDHPVFLMHISGHMGVANAKAFEMAGIDQNTPDPDGGIYVKNDDGSLHGLVEENAAIAVQTLAMDFSVFDFLNMIKVASDEYSTVGVTTAQSGAVDIRLAQGLGMATKFGLTPLRLEVWPMFDQLGPMLLDGSQNAESLSNDRTHIGAIKIVADGSIQGYTGYLSHPYHAPYHGDESYRGYPRVLKQDLIDNVEKYHAAGYQIAIHGNGDASIDDILTAIELAQQKHPREDARHIIVHAQMSREDQLDKMKALGVTPTFFVAHTYYWGDRHRDIFMGPERAARMSPTASALAKGLPFTIHLDTPVVPMKPMLLVWTAVNRLSSSGAVIGAEQRISVEQALRAVTIDAAWQIHQEKNRGSIEAGKLADLVVLASDPRQQPETLKDIPVMRTVIGGITTFSAQ